MVKSYTILKGAQKLLSLSVEKCGWKVSFVQNSQKTALGGKNKILHSLPDIATTFLISFSKMFSYSFIMFWSQSTKWQVRILHFPPKYYWNILWCRKEYESIQSWSTSQDTVFTWCLTDTLSPEKLSVQMPLHGCLATRIRTKQIQK